MNHDDVGVGKIYARINLRDFRIVPFGDRAHVNSSQRMLREFQVCAHSRHVVAGHGGAEYGGEVQDLKAGLLQLLVVHGHVGSAKVHGMRLQLPDSAAGADALVIDLHVRHHLVIFVEPLRVDRVGEGRACRIELYRIVCCQKACKAQTEREQHLFHGLSGFSLAPILPPDCYNSITTPKIRGERLTGPEGPDRHTIP